MKGQLNTLLTLIPLAHALAITPAKTVAPRDINYKDVIRFQKCSNLWKRVEGTGLWEMGQIAYWKTKDQAGAPEDRVVFDMATPVSDYFWNDHGDMKDTQWGGDIEGGGSMRANIKAVSGVPEDGAYVGYVDRAKDGLERRFNCHATGPRISEQFQYTEEERKNEYGIAYGTCSTWVECEQVSSVKVQIIASEEVTSAWEMTRGPEIWQKFSEVFDETQGLCREDKLPISAKENKCTVTFDCNAHGNDKVLKGLRETLEKFDYRMYKEWEKDVRGNNDRCEDTGMCLFDRFQTWRSVPSVMLLAAHSIPDKDRGLSHPVSYIKVKTECEKPEGTTDTICDALGAMFSAGSQVAKFSAIMEGASIATEIGCSVAKAVEAHKPE